MLQLNAHVSAEDLEKNAAFIQENSKLASHARWVMFLLWLVLGLVIYFACFSFFGVVYLDFASNLLIATSGLLFAGTLIASVIWQKHGGRAAWFAQCSGDYVWQLNAEGISLRRNEASGFFAWSQIIALVESADTWYFYLRRNLAVCIPKSANNNPQEFTSVAAQYWRKHPDNAGLELSTSLAAGLKQRSFWADLSTNLLCGLKLAFFAKVKPLDFKVSTSQWLGLVVLDLILMAFFNYCEVGPKPQFNQYGFSTYVIGYIMHLLAGMCICAMLMTKSWLPRLMVMLFSVTFATSIFYVPLGLVLADSDISLQWFVWGGYIVWLLVVVARTIKLLFNYPLPTIFFLTTVYSFFVLTVASLFAEQQFFIKRYYDDYADYKANKINVEATYYAQSNLVQQALSNIEPERAGVADLYFIGLAGASYQDVFKNEVQFTQQLFNQQFDTAKRSMLLVNHKDTLTTLPIANLPNLSAALNGVAQKMNKEEDILFLFLSSHGSAPSKTQVDYEISTDFYPLEPSPIEAKKLKAALDTSGIKNRVIVVSACHSGGFIDALKDDNSLILTASRKDRSSFGCSSEEKYTYFGDAYFVQSLSQSAKAGQFDFNAAFDAAKKIISQKEAAEQKDSPASEPQRYEGAAIKAKLAALQARLQSAH